MGKDVDMTFNPSICQVLHITRLKTPIQTKYLLRDIQLESVLAAKYLGGYHLRWPNLEYPHRQYN